MHKIENKRSYNLELLKFICIIGIILHHYCLHGGICNQTDIDSLTKILVFIGKNIGKICSNTFVLITGYFLFDSNFKIEKIIKIILEFIFYSLIVVITMNLFLKINYKYYIYAIFPIFFNAHWFPIAFIGMYILLPFFKKSIKNYTKKEFFIILSIFGILISVVPSIISLIFNLETTQSYGTTITLLFISLIGGCISKYKIIIFKNKLYNIIILFTSFIVFGLIDQLKSDNSIFVIICSILLLDLFLKIRINEYKIIRFFSSASLGILLLFDNRIFVEQIWTLIFSTNKFYQAPFYILISHIYICIFSIVVVGAIIDYCRKKFLENNIQKLLDKFKYLDKINSTFNSNC